MVKVLQIFAVLLALLIPSVLYAQESFCPNGSNPNPNILYCEDFESAASQAQWSSGTPRASNDRPFMGTHSMLFELAPRSTGGFTEFRWNNASDEIWVRYYILLNELWHFGRVDDHVMTFCSGTCTSNYNMIDLGPEGFNLSQSVSTVSGSRTGRYHNNIGNANVDVLQNARWYRIELHRKFNTPGVADGILEIFVDGTKVSSFTNLATRTDVNTKFNGIFLNNYLGTGAIGIPGKLQKTYRDNIVVANGSYGLIGPAIGEPSNKGTPDPASPYDTYAFEDWFGVDGAGRHVRAGTDCTNATTPYTTGVAPSGQVDSHCSHRCSFVSSPVRNLSTSHCLNSSNGFITGGGQDMALRGVTTSGHEFAGVGPTSQWYNAKTHVSGGYFYLDPANAAISNPVALSGFMAGYNNRPKRYVAMGIDASGHPVLMKQMNVASYNVNSPPQVIATNTSITITSGQWHQFEVRATDAGDYTVWLNGSVVLSASATDTSTAWLTSDLANEHFNLHAGILDHNLNPSPFTVYLDEVTFSTASFRDCFGWGAGFCPHTSGPGGDTLSPAAPQNLQLLP